MCTADIVLNKFKKDQRKLGDDDEINQAKIVIMDMLKDYEITNLKSGKVGKSKKRKESISSSNIKNPSDGKKAKNNNTTGRKGDSSKKGKKGSSSRASKNNKSQPSEEAEIKSEADIEMDKKIKSVKNKTSKEGMDKREKEMLLNNIHSKKLGLIIDDHTNKDVLKDTTFVSNEREMKLNLTTNIFNVINGARYSKYDAKEEKFIGCETELVFPLKGEDRKVKLRSGGTVLTILLGMIGVVEAIDEDVKVNKKSFNEDSKYDDVTKHEKYEDKKFIKMAKDYIINNVVVVKLSELATATLDVNGCIDKLSFNGENVRALLNQIDVLMPIDRGSALFIHENLSLLAAYEVATNPGPSIIASYVRGMFGNNDEQSLEIGLQRIMWDCHDPENEKDFEQELLRYLEEDHKHVKEMLQVVPHIDTDDDDDDDDSINSDDDDNHNATTGDAAKEKQATSNIFVSNKFVVSSRTNPSVRRVYQYSATSNSDGNISERKVKRVGGLNDRKWTFRDCFLSPFHKDSDPTKLESTYVSMSEKLSKSDNKHVVTAHVQQARELGRNKKMTTKDVKDEAKVLTKDGLKLSFYPSVSMVVGKEEFSDLNIVEMKKKKVVGFGRDDKTIIMKMDWLNLGPSQSKHVYLSNVQYWPMADDTIYNCSMESVRKAMRFSRNGVRNWWLMRFESKLMPDNV